MKYLSSGVTVVLVAACAAAVGYHLSTRSASSNAMPAEQARAVRPAGEIQQLQQQIAALQQQLLSMRYQQGSGSTGATVAQADAVQKQPLVDDAAERAVEEQQREAYMTGIAQSFNSEPVDVRWSSTTAASVRAALDNDEVLRSLARSVDCRQQTCRVDIEDDGSARVMKSLPMLANSVAAMLPSVSAERIDNGNGRSTMVLYMSRALPSAEVPQRPKG